MEQTNQRVPIRDFLFIDEAGEPGTASNYYIAGLIHLTDIALEKINIHLGALRYFGNIRKELKSTSLSPDQKKKISEIILFATEESLTEASVVYVDKNNYEGNYLGKNGSSVDGIRFRNHIARELLEFHFASHPPRSKEIELIFDRVSSDEKSRSQLSEYLRADRTNILPGFSFITQADSRYIELLQVADWIVGVVKEKYFTHIERDYEDFLNFISIKQLRN